MSEKKKLLKTELPYEKGKIYFVKQSEDGKVEVWETKMRNVKTGKTE